MSAIHCKRQKEEPEEIHPDKWAAFESCEHFRTAEMQKWCFEQKFTDLFKARLQEADFSYPDELIPDDTLLIFVDIDTSGHISFGGWADEASPAPDESLKESLEHILSTFPVVRPAMYGDRPLKIRYTLPVVKPSE